MVLGLVKPAWLPPQHWLGPIWIGLYVLMAIAAWIIWRERYHRGRAAAIVAFCVQLLLNALWAPLFFGLRNIGAGLFVSWRCGSRWVGRCGNSRA